MVHACPVAFNGGVGEKDLAYVGHHLEAKRLILVNVSSHLLSTVYTESLNLST